MAPLMFVASFDCLVNRKGESPFIAVWVGLLTCNFIISDFSMSSSAHTQLVLVTGAANGIGKAMVTELARLQYNIAAWDVDQVGGLVWTNWDDFSHI